MIFFDDYGYPVNETGDGGDSLVRASILKTEGENDWQFDLKDYIPETGKLVRHPKQEPWNFYGNNSRDQMIMSLMALKKQGLHKEAAAIFWAHLKRFFFCQNFYRDYGPSPSLPKGSRKYPWPHEFHIDSDPKKPLDRKTFDFADPLMPNHIGALILAGRVRLFYFFLPLAYLVHFISLWAHSKSKHHEENQMIAESYVYGTLRIYRWIKPRWATVSYLYWFRRGEIEYHHLLERMVLQPSYRGPA